MGRNLTTRGWLARAEHDMIRTNVVLLNTTTGGDVIRSAHEKPMRLARIWENLKHPCRFRNCMFHPTSAIHIVDTTGSLGSNISCHGLGGQTHNARGTIFAWSASLFPPVSEPMLQMLHIAASMRQKASLKWNACFAIPRGSAPHACQGMKPYMRRRFNFMLGGLLCELLVPRFSDGFPTDGATVVDALLTSLVGEATTNAGLTFTSFFKGCASAAKVSTCIQNGPGTLRLFWMGHFCRNAFACQGHSRCGDGHPTTPHPPPPRPSRQPKPTHSMRSPLPQKWHRCFAAWESLPSLLPMSSCLARAPATPVLGIEHDLGQRSGESTRSRTSRLGSADLQS
jgi:hypothetical protein